MNPEAALSESEDPERERIVAEEEACLARVKAALAARTARSRRTDTADYDARLLDLRDQIAGARTEDLPPLVQEMERLQALASRLRDIQEIPVDPRSPYFGRLVLEENEKRREILIGRATHLDSKENVRIVDWRDAPVSRLYYRYEEGEEYDEVFGDREISGIVLTRRSIGIVDYELKRVGSPQGTFVRGRSGSFRRVEGRASHLSGGAGTALRTRCPTSPGSAASQVRMRGQSARQQRAALRPSSSAGTGSPNTIMTPSPMKLVMTPPQDTTSSSTTW
jgi:DNA helicase-2/ATP-dependent DNA helicase PcrA